MAFTYSCCCCCFIHCLHLGWASCGTHCQSDTQDWPPPPLRCFVTPLTTLRMLSVLVISCIILSGAVWLRMFCVFSDIFQFPVHDSETVSLVKLISCWRGQSIEVGNGRYFKCCYPPLFQLFRTIVQGFGVIPYISIILYNIRYRDNPYISARGPLLRMSRIPKKWVMSSTWKGCHGCGMEVA